MDSIATTLPKRGADGTLTSLTIVNGGWSLFAREIPDFDETRYQSSLGPTLMGYV